MSDLAKGCSPNMPRGEEPEADMFPTEGNIGLFDVKAPENAIADIVFIHGLTGNCFGTWTSKSTGKFWPRDFLPNDLSDLRIFTYGYNADIIKVVDVASSSSLRDHGKGFAQDLAARRKRTNTTNRPLIFVAHSLGGLVTEQALLISRDSEEPHVNALLESTFAIAFMGTPHAGSDLAAWGSVLKGLSRVSKKTSHQIVEVLKPGSEMLAYVQQSFHGMLLQRENRGLSAIRIFCFYEEIGVFGIGKIVEGPSAILSRYSSRGINANHMSMTKFASPEDAGYKAISDRLWIWADEIKESSGNKLVGLDTMRAKRIERLETTLNSPNPQRSYEGKISTSGGHVVQGDITAQRDFNMGSGPTAHQ